MPEIPDPEKERLGRRERELIAYAAGIVAGDNEPSYDVADSLCPEGSGAELVRKFSSLFAADTVIRSQTRGKNLYDGFKT